MITLADFRTTIVRPALDAIGLGGAAAEQLLIGTAIQESGLLARDQRGGGPAHGLWQMERATFNYVVLDYLPNHPDLMAKVMTLAPAGAALEFDLIEDHDRLACALARVRYLPAKPPLPAAGDLAGQAAYWKSVYNSVLGAGTTDEYVRNVGAALWGALG